MWFWYLAKKEGGLGIWPHVNQALMGKGLWRIEESQSFLWKQILEDKYEVTREGWELWDSCYRHSALSRVLFLWKKEFSKIIRYPVAGGTGEEIYFSLDNWVGDNSFTSQFLNLFKCTEDHQAKVSSYMERIGVQMVWSQLLGEM